MSALPRTFDEAAEAFGAPPQPDERAIEAARTFFAAAALPDSAAAVEACHAAVDRLQGDAYLDVLIAMMGLELGATHYDRLREFFHLSAAYGEMRMLRGVIENLHRVIADRDQDSALAGAVVAGHG